MGPDFNALRLATKKLNPQLTHLGIIEFYIDAKLKIPGAQEVLQYSIIDFNLPTPRRVDPVTIRYLNGAVRRPGQVQPIGEATVNFADYTVKGPRAFLHAWFNKVYNKRTGIGYTPADLMCDARAIMFANNGLVTTQYYLFNIWPMNEPAPANINYGSGGQAQIQMQFAMDDCIDEIINGVPQDIGLYSNFMQSPTLTLLQAGASGGLQ